MPRDYEKRKLGINRSTDYQEYMRRYMKLVYRKKLEKHDYGLKKVK